MEESSRTGIERRPAWLPREVEQSPPVDIYHIWAPRPLERSIPWTPIGEARRNAPAGAYEVFVEQRVLEAMYTHVWGAGHADEPFGYLFGDLCEDRESKRRYVVITRAVASAYPLFEDDPQQISAEAARALRHEEGRNGVVLAGWYHRHREGPAQLSEEDEATHREHFGEPWQVAFLFVTDPDQPAGGCFQPRTYGVTAHTPLPFYELASVGSLLAKGVRRTRVDWENVETETKIVADAPPRPEVSPEEREAVAVEDESGAEAAIEPEVESVETEIELEEPEKAELGTETEIEAEAAVEAETALEAPVEDETAVGAEDPVEPEPGVAEAESASEEPVETVSELEVQESEDRDRELAEEPSEEVEVDLQPVPVVFHAPVSELRFDLVSTPEEQPLDQEEPLPVLESETEIVPPEAEAEPEIEAEPGVVPDVQPELEVEATLEPEATLEAEPEPEPAAVAVKAAIVSTAIVSPVLETPALDTATPQNEVNHDRRRKLVAVVEGVLAAAAIGAVVAGAWPLRYGNPTATDQPGLVTAVAGFVMPARETVPTLDESEASDPLTVLGRGVRAAASRYRTVAEMFAAGRLGCAPLREAYDEVDAGWTAFGERLARVPDERSEGQIYFDGLVSAEALAVQAEFTASGCAQP